MSTRNSLDSAVFNFHLGHRGFPPAGSNQSINAMVNARSSMIGFSFSLETDSNVSDRQIVLEVTNPTWTIRIGASMVIQVKDLTYDYIFGVGLPASLAAVDNQVLVPIIPDILLFEGWTWDIVVQGIQAADQLSDIYVYEKTWTFEQ